MPTIPNESDLPPLVALLQRFAGVDPALVHLDENTAAACLGQKPKTLEAWRRAGKELPFLKLGRSVRYRLSDVLVYVDRHVYTSSRQARERDRSPAAPRRRRVAQRDKASLRQV
jgi:hypothetical protein